MLQNITGILASNKYSMVID